jgi:hypothetical protein
MTFGGGTDEITNAPLATFDTVTYVGGISDTVGTIDFSSVFNGFSNWASASVMLVGTPIASPSSIPAPVPSVQLPWVALSSESVSTQGVNAATKSFYGTPGTHTYELPAWLVAGNHLDIITVSDGGSGASNFGIENGPGGGAGLWAKTTLLVGATGPTGIKAGTAVTATLGGGGAAPTFYWENGKPGSGVTISWVDADNAPQSLTVVGGAAGVFGVVLSIWGASPGTETYLGVPYVGGAEALNGWAGNAPGGGGGGSGWLQYGSAGAPAGAWFTARQT